MQSTSILLKRVRRGVYKPRNKKKTGCVAFIHLGKVIMNINQSALTAASNSVRFTRFEIIRVSMHDLILCQNVTLETFKTHMV